MKTYPAFLVIIIVLSLSTGCLNMKPKDKTGSEEMPDTTTVADTGFTGIKKYYSKNLLMKEVTFKNGVREGLMKTYYMNGKLYQTFWYVNGMREDTARWYYEDGKVFRATPFKRDSMDGVQTQYYKNGKMRAKLSYVNGIRTPYLEEYLSDGTKVTSYPDIIVRTKDEYAQNGSYKIYLELTNKSVKAAFYKGEYIDGLFVPKQYRKINATEYTGYLELKKSGTSGSNYAGIIAEISTSLGNKYLVYKKIDLPYNDLK